MAIEQAPEINMFEGAIPGQSMASSPESKMAWDGPPQYAGIKEASEAIFLSLLEEENLTAILDLLENDVPISEITSVLLLTGFSKGQYNPDLLMMLIEPVMYMIMAIADRFGIENVKIYKGEEEDYNEDFDEDITGQEIEDAKIESLKDIFNNKRISPDLRNTIENSEIAKKLESIDIDSLMARREEKPMPTSLLEQGK